MRSVETPNGTVITGLLPAMYDGVNLTEVSPVLYPDMANVAQSAGAGTIPAGTYYVIAMFEYTLANSSVIRGITSVPATVTVDGSHSISFVYRYATFRDYEHPTIQSVKIYVSSDDAVYYLQKTYGPGCVGVGNVPDYSTTTEQLYTVGGVLDNGCPPSLLDVITRNNRLYGVDSRGQIYYTKELVSTIAPEWSEYLVKSLRPDGGSYWQLAALDDRMLAFGTGSIQVLTGDGLDSAGASDTLSSPTVLPVDAGIIANSPVAVSEDGVWCKSSGVIYLLDRSLSLQKVGSPVSGIAYTLVSVALVPVKRQIRFGHSDGSALVFDTLKKEWSEFRNHTQVAAINNGGVYTLLKSDGTVWFQSSGYVDGDGAAIGMTIEIPWLHIGALQGVQRLYWANLIGEYLSSISLAISTYHDGAATATETVTYAKTSGTAGDQLEVRHADGRRCESIKIKIVDTSSGAGATLVGFTMEIGARAGTKRHASSQTV
jgi:hypothetical protein